MVELLKEREQLDQEEDVFDLPATQYPGLDNAVVVMQQLREVFTIYQQLRVSKCQRSPFLFFDLIFLASCFYAPRITYFCPEYRDDMAYNALGLCQAG